MEQGAVADRWHGAVAIVLSFGSGATDAFAFLNLGGIFTAMMTGNLVIASLTQRPNYAETVLGATVSIASFALSVYLCLRVARKGAGRERLVIVLAAAFLAQAGVLAGWALSSSRPLMLMVTLISLSAAAMGAQTAVARRIESRSGVTTTYVTGTITAFMAAFADRTKGGNVVRAAVIPALVLGALSGSMLMRIDPTFGAALPLLPSAIGLVLIAIAPAPAATLQPAAPSA